MSTFPDSPEPRSGLILLDVVTGAIGRTTALPCHFDTPTLASACTPLEGSRS
jgi:hypothetical protein